MLISFLERAPFGNGIIFSDIHMVIPPHKLRSLDDFLCTYFHDLKNSHIQLQSTGLMS